MHPRTGCRRQLSRLRRWVLLRPWRLDWRGGNCRSLRRINCPTARGRNRWSCRGQRRRDRWVWFFWRIQRERGRQGEVGGGQCEPREGMSQCQECASACRNHTFYCAHGSPFKRPASWSETQFHSNRFTFRTLEFPDAGVRRSFSMLRLRASNQTSWPRRRAMGLLRQQSKCPSKVPRMMRPR
jgi:hypothetical protein